MKKRRNFRKIKWNSKTGPADFQKIVKWNSKTRKRTPTKREGIQNKKQNPKLTKFNDWSYSYGMDGGMYYYSGDGFAFGIV